MWGKIALKDRLTTEAGYSTLTEGYKNLISQSGVTLTVMKPTGTIKINGKRYKNIIRQNEITLTEMKPTGTVKINEKEYSALSTENLIKKDKKIKVISVDGTKIQVESID